MKNSVIKRNSLDTVQYRTKGVEKSPCEQPVQTGGSQTLYKRFYCKNNNPPHKNIHKRRKKIVSSGKEYFKDNTGKSHSPGNTENEPSHPTVKNEKGKRCIGSGNKNIDGGVIENP